jgi:hypothetical protein
MPHLEDDREAMYAMGRQPGRFYASGRFPQGGAEHAAEAAPGVELPMCRFGYQVVDGEGEIIFESDQGWEIVLRETPSRQQLKALFFEDTREIQTLTFQRFNASGIRLDKESFTLLGIEVARLRTFLSLIGSQSLDLAQNNEGIRLLPAEIEAVLADEDAQAELYRRFLPAIQHLYEADVDAPEIVAFARRRQQLQVFEELLHDEDAFARRRAALRAAGHRSGAEDVWQEFFEANHWIFGTGLAPQFLHAWNEEKLEQTVVGSSIFEKGKRPDAVMRTAGALSALAFVEIKRHDTDLLHNDAYRPGTWRVSDEVAGGIAQCQITIDQVVRRAEHALDIVDDDGYRTGESALICHPRSLLVIGSLDEFVREGNPHVPRFQSFERFRRSIRDPEIITFDELYERAAMSVALSRPHVRSG